MYQSTSNYCKKGESVSVYRNRVLVNMVTLYTRDFHLSMTEQEARLVADAIHNVLNGEQEVRFEIPAEVSTKQSTTRERET